MSPSEIPRDILDKAEAIHLGSLGRGMKRTIEMIAEALWRERQRCAEVARAHRSKIDVNEPLWHDGADWACDRIAEAIIAGTAPDAGARCSGEEQ